MEVRVYTNGPPEIITNLFLSFSKSSTASSPIHSGISS